MTRIKTIGFSLKAFSAKLQRLITSHPFRIAGCGFLLAVLLHSLLTAGCGGGGGGAMEISDFTLQEEEMEGVRFVPGEIDLNDIFHPFQMQAASALWLKSGDAIAPRWDTFEWHWERKGAMCEFLENISTDVVKPERDIQRRN